jgi:hypothetical protein
MPWHSAWQGYRGAGMSERAQPPYASGGASKSRALKVVCKLDDAAIAAQAGWSERSISKMVETYRHAVDERRLDEIDAAFKRTRSETQSPPNPATRADLNQYGP